MMIKLGLVYIGCVFLAGTGVLQAAAAFNDLYGLLYFPKKLFSYFFALITIGITMAVLFAWNWHFSIGIIQGAQQAGLFFIGMVLALIFTLLASSILNHRRFPLPTDKKEGLDALGNRTFIQAISSYFRKQD